MLSFKSSLLVALGFLLFSCGSKNSEPQVTNVGVSLSSSNPKFSLMNTVVGFTINMEECVSGFSSTATQETPQLKAYVGDVGCLAKIKQINFNNTVWVASSNDGFKDYQPGDEATFVSDKKRTESLSVKVVSQLSSEVSSTDHVEYAFNHLAPGNDDVVDGVQVISSAFLLGQKSPNYEIQDSHMIGLTKSGAGKFIFSLECAEALQERDGEFYCEDTKVSGVRYSLFKDTFPPVLTFEQVRALFAGDKIKTVNLKEDLILAGNKRFPNGGFSTKIGNDALQGPDRFHDHPNLLLILENQGSFKVFRVHIAVYE